MAQDEKPFKDEHPLCTHNSHGLCSGLPSDLGCRTDDVFVMQQSGGPKHSASEKNLLTGSRYAR
jgi:hypothetical protein